MSAVSGFFTATVLALLAFPALFVGAVALGFLKRGHETEREGFEIRGKSASPKGPVADGPGVGREPG